MFEDFLADTWAYQEILQKGLLQGRQEAFQLAHQEELQRQRKALMYIVQMRFPELAVLAKKRGELLRDPAEMEALIDKIYKSETMKDARKVLNETKSQNKAPQDQASS